MVAAASSCEADAHDAATSRGRVEPVKRIGGDVAHPCHVRAREQQSVRIEITGFDEPLRFLRAAARVGAVDEPALPVHEVVQVAACACELLPEGVARDLQQLSANAVGHAEDTARM